LLNEVLFTSLAQARQALRAWKDDYNTVRPHSAIGNIPPAIYAAISAPEKQRAGTPALVEGSAPHPVAQQPKLGSNVERILLPNEGAKGLRSWCLIYFPASSDRAKKRLSPSTAVLIKMCWN
jgi:hypothetical protein